MRLKWRSRPLITPRVRALACACTAALASGGCSRDPRDTYQGYVEGEFVYLASSQSGQLTQLAVARGPTCAGAGRRHPCRNAIETR